MASSLVSNTNQVYFASILSMDNSEMLSTSCKKRELKIEYRLLSDIVAKSITVKVGSYDAVTHERFFLMTAIFGGMSVNWGRLIFKIFKDMVTPETRQARGYVVHICILLKNIPDLELGDSEEFPPLKILTAKIVGRYIAINDKIAVDSVEVLAGKSRVNKTPVKRAASKKRPVVAIEEQVVKKKRTLKGKAAPSFQSEALVSVALDAEPLQTVDPTSADDVDTIIEQVIAESAQLDTDVGSPIAPKADEMEQWINLSYEEFLASDANRRVDTASDTDGEPETIFEKQPVQRSAEKEKDVDFGAITAAEVTKTKFGLTVEIHEVQDTNWYYASLPKISTLDKGKKPLEADDVVKGNPAREMVQLICGDVEFLVQLREQVIQDVVSFFQSFSLSQLLDLESVRVVAEKENLMFNWVETTSLETAVKRRMYIIVKYREMLLRKFLESHRKFFAPGQPWTAMASQIIDLLSTAHLQSLDALLVQEKEHGLIADRPCSSKSLDDSADSSSVVLAQFYSLAKSTCWVRPMVLIDGIWTPLQGNEFCKSSCRLSLFVNRRQLPKRATEDCLAPHCYFIEPDQYWGATPSLVKMWGWFRVCTDIIRYSMFGCLRPVGSVNPCRYIVVKSSVVDILEKVPTGFCDVLQQGTNIKNFVEYFSDSVAKPILPCLPEVELVSSDVSSVYRSPSPQYLSSSSNKRDFHLRTPIDEEVFATTTVGSTPAVAQFSLPPAVSDSFNDLRTSMSRIISLQSKESRRLDDSHNEEAHNDTKVLSLGLKAVRTQTAILTTNQADAHKEAKEQKAIIKDIDERLATLRSEQLDFHAQAHENYKNLSSHLGELVAYINCGNEKKGEESSSRRPQPPPMIKIDPVGVMQTEEVVEAVLVEVAEEMIERALQRKGDLVAVVLVDRKKTLNGGYMRRISF
ncbi:patatin-like protein 2 [Dorcoceras hygrometricum]|uniref:Patatin-like protein 2 n=1 Tax=Dorcoceras hygrometricum TaxID=472368 RepID=A0A2Z7CPH9_9LAMI|nr:patatin-like protein 2 [Dorcoceras hygrometricum]